MFTARHLGRTEEIMRAVCADSGAGLAEFNSETSHVHLLVTCSPQAALSRLVNSLKGLSSRRLRQEHPETPAAGLEGEPAVVRVLRRRVEVFRSGMRQFVDHP